ncbi:MAG: PPC domain-containing protein, partial [Deltaproteobacteria bacterium]
MRRRKHQRDLICSFALSIFLLLPSVVFADDHGNTYSAATPISTDGTLYDGEIEIGGDVDYFSFSAASGYRYVILTSQLVVLFDTFIHLYDTDGTTELASDDDSGQDLFSRIVWQANSPGTYYVRVKHFNDTDTGTYNISITGTRLAGICEP